ncbi:zeta-sarcoglycan [Patella vulgata]|uniref:zeta-sarcoglycan n=1 Tax=Patella vulgata TaxID=6465 RepID=UPI00217F7BC0|nr:zeta-sarcoglycan [Patella vulgata]XP_050416870.1 zeta-sarcoglycan [Patella vulgata]
MPQTTGADAPTDANGLTNNPPTSSDSQPIGIYGWRKRCLYSFILFLMVVVIMNLALTIWILRVFDFSVDGIGRLRMTPKGVRLDGEAEFLKSVYTQEIRSKTGDPLYVESSQEVKIQSRNKANHVTSSLNLDNEKFQAKCEIFEVKDRKGKIKFLVSKDKVIIGTDEVKYNGEVIFDGSIETPSLRGPISEELKIESPSSSVEISGSAGVSVQAPAGDVELKSQDNIRLQTSSGAIHLDSKDIFLKNIKESDTSGIQGVSSSDIYQLCMCQNGRVFLAEADGICSATSDVCNS